MAETSKPNGPAVSPQHVPPARLNDPFVRRLPVGAINPKRPKDGYHLWNRAIRGRLPKLADYAVARGLATYGNADGTHCRPGLARLAGDLSTSEKSVQRSVDYLTEHGWLHWANPGIRKRGEANEYTLSIPAPVAVEFGWWTNDPADSCQWIERPSCESRRPAARVGGHLSPPKRRLGGQTAALGGQNGSVTVDTGVQPPGSTHHLNHHSDSLNRPHAHARGNVEVINPDSLEAADQIVSNVEGTLGFEASVFTQNLIDSMLAEGRPIKGDHQHRDRARERRSGQPVLTTLDSGMTR